MNRTSLYMVAVLIFTFLWACEKDVAKLQLKPDAGSGFTNVENDGYFVTLGAQAAPEGQEGTWRIYIGENGHFDDVNDPHTNFYGEPGENYLLGWELSRGSEYESSTIDVSFKAMMPVLRTSVVDTVFNNISLHLTAEEPKFGAEGRWEIVNGLGGRIEKADSHQAQFIGLEYEFYTVRWILSYGSKKEYLDLSFTTDVLKADAGVDQVDLIASGDKKFYNLDAFLPAGSTGKWDVLSGEPASVHNIDNPKSLFEGVADSLYTLTWTVDLDGQTSVDTVDIRFRGKWGVWTDPRDKQTYRFAEINGLEWMAENYNYAYDPGVGSVYYGFADRAVIKTGHAIETEEERKYYGRLYNWYTASDAAPEGWRLPTYIEFEDMLVALGGRFYADPMIKEGGESGLDLVYGGYFDRISGEDPAYRNVFNGMDLYGYYWTADYQEDKEATSAYGVIESSEAPGFALLSAYYASLSVRYVREVSK